MKNTKKINTLLKRVKRRVGRIEKLISLGRIICDSKKMDAFEQICRLEGDAEELLTAILDFDDSRAGID